MLIKPMLATIDGFLPPGPFLTEHDVSRPIPATIDSEGERLQVFRRNKRVGVTPVRAQVMTGRRTHLDIQSKAGRLIGFIGLRPDLHCDELDITIPKSEI